MKTKAITFFILGLLFYGFEAFPQSVNQLSIPLTDGKLGQEILVPVYMTNEAEITGIQVNIQFPQDAQVNTQGVTLSDRKGNHTINVRSIGNNNYLFVIFSISNELIKGNSGILFYIPVTIPQNWQENTSYPITFNEVVLSSVNGNNLATVSDPGAIKVITEPHPDFTVDNIRIDKSSVAPGEKFIVSWTVKNIGDKATAIGWNERITLLDDNDNQTYLGMLYQNGIIDVAGSVNRQAEFSLSQLPGIEGNVRVSVQIIPDPNSGELPGSQGNNTALSDQSFTITKKLLLEVPAYALPESSAALIQCKLSRSGNWSEQQVFTLSTSDPQRVNIPASVTIPAQQSGAFFYIQTINNNVLDEDSLVAINAWGSGYDIVTQQVIIEDANLPSLLLTGSKTEVTQGETFTLTVERERVSSSELTVSLTCNLSKRFDFPAQVTIPANQKSITVNVTAIDDNLPDITRDVEFAASTAKYTPAKLQMTLYNNNLPEISLTLTPQTVSKSAGPLAIKAVLRRLSHTDSQITVDLSDDSNGRLYYSNPRITLQSGVEEVQFTIGVIDNDLVEGDQTVDITAAVYVSSCGCSVSGTSAGVVHASVTILDTNSPALKMVSSQPMLPEGKTDATTLTITRNTPPTDDLEVTISCDNDSDLVYEKIVTIPAGSVSVEVPVSVLPNTTGISKGDRTIVFTVTANGYKNGTCWAMISDQTLPDAVVSSISLSGTELMAEGETDIQVVVSNTGAAPLPAHIPVNIYLSNSSDVLTSFYTTKVLGVSESETIVQTIHFPNITGSYTVYAIVNENQAVKELMYLNNTSEKIPVKLLPKFSATTTTDKKVYKQGEAVIISGQLTGNATANATVEVYLINSGIRQTLNVTTDDSGHFQVTFQPSVYQSGHFIAGACYPNEGLTLEQVAFDVYGVKREGSGYITNDLTVNEPYQGTINLTNTGVLALTNVRAEIVSSIDNGSIVFNPVNSIAGNATAAMNYTLTGTAPSEGSDWQQIKIRITSNESELLELTIYVYFRSAKGKLEANIAAIQTTMAKGASRDYPFTITNTGKGETGKISLSLPANATWLSAATSLEMASLTSNESATVVLRFTPTDDLALNVPITGTIGVNCENGTGFPLSFSVEPVSESTGTLVVDVCDEYTYYTAEAPHLANAKVTLRHPVTNALIAEGFTDSNGLFTVSDLPEGYYSIEVSADKHDKYQNNILVDPEKETKTVVNLSFQAITIDWNVVETTVEDQYDITTTVKYETNVPVPVIVAELPTQLPVDELLDKGYYMFNAVLTNKGLITANNVKLTFPDDPALLFEYPAMDDLNLKPQESIVIPIKVSVISGENPSPSSLRAATDFTLPTIPCKIVPFVYYEWECGPDNKGYKYPVEIKLLKCTIPIGTGGSGGSSSDGGSGGGLICPVGGGSGGSYSGGGGTNNPPTIVEDCKPCEGRWIKKLVECGISFIPVYGCASGTAICDYTAISGKMTGWDYTSCTLTGISCFTELCTMTTLATIVGAPVAAGCKIVGWIVNGINCLVSFLEPCNPLASSSRGTQGFRSTKQNDEYPSYIIAFQEKAKYALNELEASQNILLEYFGSDEWLNTSTDEISNLLVYILQNKTIIDPTDSQLRELKPSSITDKGLDMFIERLNNTTRIANGENLSSTNYINGELMSTYRKQINEAEEAAHSFGYTSMDDMMQKEKKILDENIKESSSSVCASISLQFSQTMTMTRQAFRGTLTVFNGNETTAMQNVKLNLVVKDELGNVATSHEFQINNESLKDFGGDLNGVWTLDPQKTGVATIVFIPTKYAAPTEPVNYSFGGTLSYLDPFTGLEVTRDLYPVTLTVKPSPYLDLTYFMQRDILGDDPLTPEIEPSVPAEFSLLINNEGAGDATNVRMITQQPQIVDNQKGLLINFELLSSQLNGGDRTLALGSSVATDFGDIPAGKTTYAQWWFTGSLLGHFTEYDVKATHVTSYGNPDLSLLNEDALSIHELIRSIRTPNGADSFLTGFVVNDIPDAEDLPDRIYLSDGSIEPVAVTTNIQSTPAGNNQYQLTVMPASEGWNYGFVNDPTNGQQELLSIKRLSDNAAIDLRNFWQTDRTLRDGKDPLYENKLHLVDKFGTGSEQYLLTFAPRPNVFLEVETFEGAPETVSSIAIQEITVRFNKNINASTFTAGAIRLNCQGESVDASLINITPVDERTFKLDLSAVTESDGYYVLTIQTAAITDYEGYQGKTGKSVDWNQFMGGQVQFNLKIEPENGGTVTPLPGKYDYNSTLNLQATPNEGYEFEKWSINGETLATNPDYQFTLLSSKTLLATFKQKLYDVTVNYDSNGGTVTGGGTGKYTYGSSLSLLADPAAGYVFNGWKVNGTLATDFNLLDIRVDSDVMIEALFSQKIICTVADTAKIQESICHGGSYDFFGQNLTAAGTYEHTLQTIQGCDSVVVLTLSVLPDVIVNLGDNQVVSNYAPVDLDAGNGFKLYEWSTGETTQKVTITNPDKLPEITAWVKVTNENDCMGSDTVQISYLPTDMDTPPNRIIGIFPNPVKQTALIKYIVGEEIIELRFLVYDISGRVVDIMNINSFHTGVNETEWHRKGLTSGVYQYSLVGYNKKKLISINRGRFILE